MFLQPGAQIFFLSSVGSSSTCCGHCQFTLCFKRVPTARCKQLFQFPVSKFVPLSKFAPPGCNRFVARRETPLQYADVVDMVIEASSSPSEAVPDLAGMLPSCKPAEDHDRQPVSNEEAADFTGNDRQTMTLAAMQAQRSSSASGPVATPRAAEKVDSSESGSGSSNAQLEKVAAFISSYAGMHTTCGALASHLRYFQELGNTAQVQ